MQGGLFCAFNLIWDSDADYCPNTNCGGLWLVEHRHAGSWPESSGFPWRWNGFFWRFTVQRLRKESPPPCKRSAVVEWPPGRLREISVVYLLSNLWFPYRGLGTRLGESQACSPREVEGKCSRTPPSGCPTAFWQEGSRQRASVIPVTSLGGGMLGHPRW